MNFTRLEFEIGNCDQQLKILTLYGTYLMERSVNSYTAYLFGVSGFYAEVWYTSNNEICRIGIIHYNELDAYLEQVMITELIP